MQLGPIVYFLPLWMAGALACNSVRASTGATASAIPASGETVAGPADTATAAASEATRGSGAPRRPATVGTNAGRAGDGTPLAPSGHDRLAAFAAGCFWGVEDAYRHVPGVVATTVGYAGGRTPHPDYESVCTHATGHAETVLVEYDPTRIPYAQLLRVFWKIHDPTQGDAQGPDVGSNYRSVVFTFDDDQAAEARASLQAEQKGQARPITTEIRPIGPFYRAEGYHQQYAERTGHHGCRIRVPVDAL